MMDRYMYKGKVKNKNRWFYGYIIRNFEKVTVLISEDFKLEEVEPETICKCTGIEYMDSEIAFEGDIFESQVSGDVLILRYGTYQAWCPMDKCYMDSVGFYAESEGMPAMPIGDLKEYALKIGNIFDNPKLVKQGTKKIRKGKQICGN